MRQFFKKVLSATPFYPANPAGSTIQWMHFWKEWESLPTYKFKKVLDAGFGPGHYAVALAKKYPNLEVVGYDLNTPPANGHLPNLNLKTQDLKALPDMEEFDFIYSTDVLEHIPGNQAVMDKLVQALKPGGYLYIHMPYEPKSRWILPEKWFTRYKAWAAVEHIGEQYPLSELEELLEQRGLVIQKSSWTFGHFGELLDEVDELVRQTFPRTFRYLRILYAPINKVLCRFAVWLPCHWGNVKVVARKPILEPLKAQPLVSVLIATHNSAHLVGRAIESVRAQTYQNLEIIIVDEASKDDLDSVVKKYNDPRIILRRDQENTGLPGARNKGIHMAKGDVIGFLDADDAWHPEKLEKQLACLHKNPNVGVVYCGIEFRQGETVLGYRHPKHRGDILAWELGEHVVSNATTYLVRKECFETAGVFDETLRTFGEDWELMIRFAKIYEFDFCPEPLAYYYFHDSHKSGELVDRPAKSMPDRISIVNRNRDIYDQYPAAEALVLRRMAVDYFKSGQASHGRRAIWRSLWLDPRPYQSYVTLLASLIGPQLFFKSWFMVSVLRKKVHSIAIIRSMGKTPVIKKEKDPEKNKEEIVCR